ncbi:hypothetical protein [Psychroserpens sp.]|uniref:hypothetical protein n=1 Tax=Psychroserpens sp. TaxID=2020870 RepID=UPI003C769584
MKKIIYILLIILTILGLWYFVIKSHDYQVSFESKNPKGIIYEHIAQWNGGKPFSHHVLKNIEKTPFHSITQDYTFSKDSTMRIDWELKKKNDSITKVKGYFTSMNSSLNQRFKILFGKANFASQSIDFSKKLKMYIERQNERFKLSKIDTANFEYRKYIYRTVSTTIDNKAKKMLMENGMIMNYMFQNELSLDGYPFLELTSWDKTTDSIQFNFCYPIKKRHISTNNSIVYSEKDPFKSLRIIYNGNFRTSHLAWYAYDDYFEKNNEKKKLLPIEVFLNDPQQGGDELTWRTEIYLPISNN